MYTTSKFNEYTVRVWTDGHVNWYQGDHFHRIEGPARTFPNGNIEYWLNGLRLSHAEWEKQVKKLQAPCANQVVEIEGKKYRLVPEE